MDANKKKHLRRIRRKRHIRHRVIGTSERPRVTVTRSLKHISCQVIDDMSGRTLVSASSNSKELRSELDGKGGNREGAAKVGEALAKKALEQGIKRMAFDRNGYRYHGRVAALAGALRKGGIEV